MRVLWILVLAACGGSGSFTTLAGLQVKKGPSDIGPELVARDGKNALKLTHVTPDRDSAAPLVVVEGKDFADGTIEVDVVGLPRAGAPADVRGFIGVAFHVQEDGRYESMYIRQTNGRADNQLQRNHATQYMSEPEWPWQRLREEAPGQYESYVDLEPGVWTHLRVEVAGKSARLFVNRAPQPCLIVSDMKLGATHGGVALWIGSDTEAYFANLEIR